LWWLYQCMRRVDLVVAVPVRALSCSGFIQLHLKQAGMCTGVV